jgi:hypothetical protein
MNDGTWPPPMGGTLFAPMSYDPTDFCGGISIGAPILYPPGHTPATVPEKSRGKFLFLRGRRWGHNLTSFSFLEVQANAYEGLHLGLSGALASLHRISNSRLGNEFNRQQRGPVGVRGGSGSRGLAHYLGRSFRQKCSAYATVQGSRAEVEALAVVPSLKVTRAGP